MARSDGNTDQSQDHYRPDTAGSTPAGGHDSLQSLLARLADRSRPRTEATLQADIRQLLLSIDLGLSADELGEVNLEAPAGQGRRIDVEIGRTVIEVKRQLGHGPALRRAEQQLAGYLQFRTWETGQRHLGVLTDGATWHAYDLRLGTLTRVDTHTLTAARPSGLRLFYWLEGVLATSQRVTPTPAEIALRLGASSSSFIIDRAALAALYHEHRDEPTVRLKRRLWADLLGRALGKQFVDDPMLFVEHTLLMNSAHIIAHLVMGIDISRSEPTALIRGERFARAGILGVVEHDFFGWTTEIPGGPDFVQSLVRRLARFAWVEADHDVLKELYESMIGTETRKRLGEYYTPGWLAEHMVDSVVTDPLRQRVLDPACGSGAFLFHAVRRYLAAAEAAGHQLGPALTQLSHQVIGVDLHPVAVALARITYLIAIGLPRLSGRRDVITIPVFLGDSMQWQERLDLFHEDHIKVDVSDVPGNVREHLRFPKALLDDAGCFDEIVKGLADIAAKPRESEGTPTIEAFLDRMKIIAEHRPMLRQTFELMCRLHDERRDHIWSYYTRNLTRPIWLASQDGDTDHRVDVLVGNPPWLSYRHMTREMQTGFRELSTERGLWHGGKHATQQDLSGLFVARSVQRYLKVGGSFAFVMPGAVLTADHFAGFRNGWYKDAGEETGVAFTGSWDLRRLRPHPFLIGSAVVFGRRAGLRGYRHLPSITEQWAGRIPVTQDAWHLVEAVVTRKPFDLRHTLAESPYRPLMRNGATVTPRFLFFVDSQPNGPLGLRSGRRAVRSARRNKENSPWKDLPALEGVVESEFVRPVLLGESLLPYRILPAREAVLPLDGTTLMAGAAARLDYFPGFADWWRQAEALWEAHRRSDRLSLIEQLDFRRKLTSQMPAPALRLVYSKSGMHVAAALVNEPGAVIDHSLYWAPISCLEEGLYLCAILNSPLLTELARPLMSYGKDERHVDKHVWKLPIPLYDPADGAHQRLANLGAAQHEVVSRLSLDERADFTALRRMVRNELARHPTGGQVDAEVARLLG
ncbi:N-6 DNA methylase [Micromonospora sp. NPDC048835]|uniref:N-6 DNA methylase n=1 Tax=Micromonospora sp. NPDC048835 TaxID=3155147 RepID=UPI0033C64A4E